MLGDRVRVKYLLGNKVEEEIIEVKTNGGSVKVVPPEDGMMLVESFAKNGDSIQRAAFNPAFVIVAIEERRRR